MMKFRSRQTTESGPEPPNTVIGVGSSFRGTLMVTGTLRIEGEFDGDVLNCERLEIGEHGVMRCDIEVKSAEVLGKVYGSIRALGTIELKAGAHVEGDVAAASVVMEPGVFFTGRCTMLENGPDAIVVQTEASRIREFIKS
jgi:cytoskeletal protein CcmA (bactofilin family)